ncbi:flagellar hook-basal body protein [Helicobacter pullorum MIT 98-5489]|uniref:Flagellar hook-basal body protein n=2 Tax=Helicobacter pullorum TaxID=35818 RepID=C5EXK2_9HELI|nr:flagellar hook-basal body complex protein [Helicobacter pullorum]EEQ63013.1 flagellar hook-basal body protein [Helicobacter pullorum MIT 98-5489]KPH53931.1 flagellar hook protein FlgE [Helicobacter pullorum]OCR04021.1 flagellar biosynthesis protein FlgE [Helicobacter pullorum]OCR05794.1 flagellar biosynthesis protein FlgE [Helicobacter pullorum]OCR10932.1 flagellar biosynthesis protein FlgE [Helicobacter pullorum]
MVGSLYSGISGIKTHQVGIDVTSNNIANINTTGFRANTPEFKSLFSTNLNYVNSNSPVANDYNYGVTLGSNAINTNDGTYVSADGDFNVAYSGKGWFVVGLNKNGEFDINNPNYNVKQNYFTRDGSFSLDGEGYLVNSSGYYMYGINLGKIAADGTLTGTNNLQQDYANLGGSVLEPIQIPKELHYQPTLTTEVNLAVNLNRTQNAKGITALQDINGNFSMEKFLAQDINSLMDSSGKLLDAKNYKDITFSIEQNGVTTNHTFTYGDTGANGFKSVGELIDLIKEQTGLDLALKLDENGNPSDCSLYLSNNSMQNVNVSISGRLAEKLGLSTNNEILDSAFTSQIKTFEENAVYQNGDYVNYQGMIFQKNGEGEALGNPIDNPESWNLVDSTKVPTYQENQEYLEGDFIVYEGRVYQRSAEEITMVEDPETGELVPQNPAEDTQAWIEVGENTKGMIAEYQAGNNYQENAMVTLNGILYQKVNGAGNTNPSEDSSGWRILMSDSLDSTQLNVPTYETNTEVYSDTGEKFILKNQYILIEQGDQTATPPINERWEVRSAIYDSTGKTMISQNPVLSEISFNADGSANATPFAVEFQGGSIQVNLAQSDDGKSSSNFAYTDSALKSATQDGTESGIMDDIVINEDGIILVNFTNGKVEPIGRIGIAAFVNDQGLSKVGGNLFEMNAMTINGETSVVSGPPLLAWEETGTASLKYGQVLDHMLETSNVDTGTALTDLIVYQRGYQMSAKSITTADQLMQEAIQLKRS